jgi:hypothetical protein
MAWSNLRYYPRIWLEWMRNTMKTLNHVSQCPWQDSNWALPKYKSQANLVFKSLIMLTPQVTTY